MRDESDRDGMRLVIELQKDVFPQVVLNQLYRLTDCRRPSASSTSRSSSGRPAVLDLKEHAARASSSTAERSSPGAVASSCSKREAQREIVEGLGMAITEVDLRDQDHPRRAAIPRRRAPNLMKLPLKGLERVRAPRRSPRSRDRRGRRSATNTSSPSARRRRSSRCASRASPASSARSSPKSTASSATRSRGSRAILADIELLLDGRDRDELEEIKAQLRRQAPHRDRRRPRPRSTMEDLIQEEDMVVTISHAGYIKRTPCTDLPRADAAAARARSGWRRATRTG